MISVEEARRRLLEPLLPLGAEQVALTEALGRVLAEDVAARRTQPPWAVSAMDGYAVRAADVARVPARLRVVGAAPAGQAYPGIVGRGEAVRIFTGAPMPEGADAVVIQEDAERQGDMVEIREGAPAGNLCAPGGARFPRGRGRPPARRAARSPPHRPCRGDEPALAQGASPAARRHPADRR